ncbi:nitroreductase family protein [Erwinia pyrifoliae]|uniref:nitroreductase family protein n=1 Tax=Erwinia pyrifoliae TaxID=79967 RepID=UPI0001961064|nr:nitroreductase family protein [Erwinia pyrifoliae]AUX72985.1 NADPH-dependent oxidoreductase [Erwinia pyrifoliae]MCA8876738.1 NADPH-dependent oxidoreductase [Erwinia pyrifoliae]CAX55290.1 Probable nitroreductase [Erwinia pyrifoliae Ep1/96]CAY74005.1 Iodotyrosine dehalogenase 1 precursor [Erwinia pyrifoliae DSM 12163]
MNEITQLLKSHRSDRSYSDKPVPEEVLDDIIEAAWRAPTSVNSQQVSLVVVRDAAARARIAELAGGQPWIAQAPVFITVVLDMYKSQQGIAAEGKKQIAHESIESLISGSTDVGIALGALMTAARSHGLGIVPIGGIRRDPQAMIELLQLPELTFPVAGVVLGYIDQPAAEKPRMSLAGFRHEERYNTSVLPGVIEAYNQVLTDHWQQTGRQDGDNWGNNTASYYQHIYFPQVQPAIRKQGFGVNK